MFKHIIDFLYKYKYVIIFILIILLLFCIIHTKSNKYEFLDKDIKNFKTDIKYCLNKNVFLKFIKNEKEIYYLAVVPKQNCLNISSNPNECLSNIAVLQKKKNKYALFKLTKSFVDGRYILSSVLDPKLLNNNINLNRYNYKFTNANHLCFDNVNDNDLFSFELEQTNSGMYRIKFRQLIEKENEEPTYEYLYLGECKKQPYCNIGNELLKRVCLYNDIFSAIYFEIELGPQNILEKEICQENLSEEEIKSNKAQYNYEESLYSLKSSCSSEEENIQSVKGVDESIIQDNVEKFMPIDSSELSN